MLSAMKPVESLHIVAAAIEIISQFNITWQTGSEAANVVHGDCWIIVGIKISGFSHTYDCRHMKEVCDT